MSAIETIQASIEQLIAQVGEASTAAEAAVAEAETGVTTAEGLGVESSIAALSALKEMLEAHIEQLASVASSIEETKTAAEAIAEGT